MRYLLTFFLLIFVFNLPVTAQQKAPKASATTTSQDQHLWQKALRIHRSAIVIDTHNDITSPMVDEDYDLGTPSAGKYHTDLERMEKGGMTGEFFSIYVSRSYAKEGGASRRALDMIDMVYRQAERHPQKLIMGYSTADIRRAKRQGKIAALMGIEGGHAIENSLMTLRAFYRLGIRYMTLTHSNTNDWADASTDAPRHNGLSDFGKEVVSEMNRLGMLIDVSHVSDETMSDVLDISTAPIIASHSSAKALANHPRNISDDLLKRIAKNDGVVMVNFFSGFISQEYIDARKVRDEKLKPQLEDLNQKYKDDAKKLEEERDKLFAANPLPLVPLSVLMDHFEHIIKVAGIDHVGIGSDFDGVPDLPKDMQDIAQLPNITYELLKRGYSEQDIKKVLGENLMRAFAKAETVAQISTRQVSGQGNLKRLKIDKK